MNCWHVSLTFSAGEQVTAFHRHGQTRYANLPSQLANLPRVLLLMKPCEMLQLTVEPYRHTAHDLFLPSAALTAQVLVGPSKQLKQTFQLNITLLRIPTGRRQTRWLFTSVAVLNLVISKSPELSRTQINFSYISCQLLHVHVSGLYPSTS